MVSPRNCSIFSVLTHRLRSMIVKQRWPKYRHEKRLTDRPMNRVTAKPLIRSLPIMYRITAVMSVVTLLSMIAANALSKPF